MFHCCFDGKIYMPGFALPDGPCIHFCSCGTCTLTNGHMKDGRWSVRNSVWDPRGAPEGFVSSESWVPQNLIQVVHWYILKVVMKRISLPWLVTYSLAIAMLGRKMLLQGCTSFGKSDIFWIKLSGVPRLERVPPSFTFFYLLFSPLPASLYTGHCQVCTLPHTDF